MKHDKEQGRGLRGKLDVHFGDLIILKGNDGRVAGHVIKYDKNTVTLSHNDPIFPADFTSRAGLFCTEGNRRYFLSYFSDFEVLRPREYK